MEILKPNPEDCKKCIFFIKKGSVVADRFLVKEDSCVLLNTGKVCSPKESFSVSKEVSEKTES